MWPIDEARSERELIGTLIIDAKSDVTLFDTVFLNFGSVHKIGEMKDLQLLGF